ncbi:MAG: DUF58 domain-containing protein [Deltaproteobacteria bacterium]|nr:DUF58 domain-containing protein [Deltaproteobacteria bacterium]
MPSLSYSGRVILAGASALALGGVLGGVAPLALAGSAAVTGVALAWVIASPMPRRMRRTRLEFSWWVLAREEGPRRPDEPVSVRVVLRNPTGEALTLSTPRLALSAGVRYTRQRGARIEVGPHSAVSFDLQVRPTYAGRHVLHGAWMTLAGPLGLAWVPLYFPNPLVVEVAPRGFSTRPMTATLRATAASARAGRSVRRAGEGPELRELRELRPGDPFRRIAWTASARRGRLLVRETEDESQATRVLVLDASATMRGDERGRARIDHAIELVAQAARASASTGDRLGLVAFDRRVVTRVDPGDGAAHLRALVASAVELRAVVDEDLTDVDDEALVETVARYFREQEGVDALRGNTAYEARVTMLRWIERATEGDAAMKLPVRAADPVGRALRAFCRARAIPLPMRHDPSGAAKSIGLMHALRAAGQGAREARTVMVLTDLDALATTDELRLTVGALRKARHRVSVVALAGERFIGTVPADLTKDEASARAAVEALFLEEERARLARHRTWLASAGVPLQVANGTEPMIHWLKRAATPRV